MNPSHRLLSLEAPAASSPGRVYRQTRKSSRIEVPQPGAIPDETLQVDERASVSPARAIESKLTQLLEQARVPISQLQMRAMVRTR